MYYEEPKDFITLSRIFRALTRRWFSIGLLTLLGAVATVALLVSLPNIYQSESLMYVKMGRGTVSLDPAATASSSHISLMDSRESEINSVKEMLTSRIVVERAVESVGIDRVMAKKAWYEKQVDNLKDWAENFSNEAKAKVSGKTVEEILAEEKAELPELTEEEIKRHEALEEAVERVYQNLNVKAAKDTYTLRVYCRAYSPSMARELCQAIVDEYRKVHVEAHSISGSLEFFENEYQSASQRLSTLENNLREMKNQTQLMTVIGKQELVLGEIKQLQTDWLKANADLAAARARDIELTAKSEIVPDRLDTSTAGVGNAATDSMRNQLFELEMLEKDLSSKYSSQHPMVAQVREKLTMAKKIYDQQADDRTLVAESMNPVRQELEIDRIRNLSTLEALKAQVAEVDSKLKSAQRKAEQVNEDEVRINDLERQVQLARTDVLTYGRKQEEARLFEELDTANISDVAIPQPPSLILEKVGPRRLLLTLGCTFAAFFASCMLAVFRDLAADERAAQKELRDSVITARESSTPVRAYAGKVEEARKLPEKIEKPLTSLHETNHHETNHEEHQLDSHDEECEIELESVGSPPTNPK